MRVRGGSTILAIAVLWAVGCRTVERVGRATTELVTGGGEPTPERIWNAERTWKRVSESPPTYVPYNYTGSTDGGGEWMRDERDGKRFFIPSGGVEGIPESVLRAEAWKATTE